MMSAIHQAAQLANGPLLAADLMATTLARIASEDAALGAFTALLDLPAARQQLTQLQASGMGPLQGLPVGLKDIFDTDDLPTRYGSALYSGGSQAEQTPRVDAAIVGAIRRAGGGKRCRIGVSACELSRVT